MTENSRKKTISISKKHIAIIIFLLGVILAPLTLLLSPINIQTNLFSLLPTEKHNPLKEKAFELVSKEAAQKITLLFAHTDKNSAHQAAMDFYQQNKNAPFMSHVDFLIGKETGRNLNTQYFKHRYHLLSQNHRKLLKENNGQELRNNAIRKLYSPMGIGLSSSIKEDPFLLFNDFMMELPSNRSSLFPYQKVLMAEHEGTHYAFMSITIARELTFALTKLADTMETIEKSAQTIMATHNGANVIITGIPVHSYSISQQSIHEINIISIVSLLSIIALIYYFFHSAKPFILAIVSIATGFAAAFPLTHLLFGEIHLITIIFGTSLIGVSIDYSFHFFAEYLNTKETNDGKRVLKRIFPGITLGLITSLMGYISLSFTPLPGLQQIACFSMIGLTVSYITVALLYPLLYKPSPSPRADFLLRCSEQFLRVFKKIAQSKATILIALILTVITTIGLFKLTPNDDIRLLYTSSETLMAKEILTRKVLGQPKGSQFFLIQAENQEELLQKEEELSNKLNALIDQQQLGSHLAISQIVPSKRTQQQNYQLIKEQLMKPYLNEQAKALGLNNTNTILEYFTKHEKHILTLEEVFSHPSSSMLKPLWLGKIDGAYGSIILLNNITSTTALKTLNQEENGIYFMDKVEDISNILQKYRHISIRLLIAVHILILLLLIARYKPLRATLIFLPPVAAALLTLAILGYAGYAINLFNIMALFLVLGIGIDYTIFYAEGHKHSHTTLIAIFLSCVTTMVSFGLLSFSNFAVIHSFGLVVLLGIFFVYLLSPIVTLAYPKPSSE